MAVPSGCDYLFRIGGSETGGLDTEGGLGFTLPICRE
jgi:hypothetical protein